MDFTKFDARGKAEAGKAFPILHPETLVPLEENGKVAKFIVRGHSSPSVQAAQKAALVQKMALATDESEVYTMETLHEDTIKEALLFLVGFENVELGGAPVTIDNAAQFLNLVFPRVVKDLDTGTFKTVNKTFAIQVLERAGELEASLGNESAP